MSMGAKTLSGGAGVYRSASVARERLYSPTQAAVAALLGGVLGVGLLSLLVSVTVVLVIALLPLAF